ncbi:MAG: hypothetical protein KDJ47_19190 [Hyphomicrobiaceae bacterium]|nr:hypothetical protein [Hyphomicrobiaceae bacterium]
MLFRLAARPVTVVLVAANMALGLLSAAHAQPASAAPAAKDKAEHDAAEAAMAANQDWPCIQHKQPVLTATQMWDGPQIAAEGKVSEDAAIQKLVPILTSRRIAMDEAEKDIKAFAEAQPADQRDAKLAELFGAALAAINAQRSTVMSGIEKFQRQQVLRSHKLEQDGAQLAELLKVAETDFKNQNATQAAAEAQTRYDWDARVFQERQKNMPIACEIPVLIEQRAFALAQAIRNQMAN